MSTHPLHPNSESAAASWPAPKLLAETERWLVVEKPAGWLSVRPSPPAVQENKSPEEADGAATALPTTAVLIDWLKERYGEVFIVHRLDVQTSGVILFARTRESHRQANQWFEKHEVRKTYHALACGAPASPTMKASGLISGQPATTLLEVKERFSGAFLCVATPRSGRRHQIRRHLSGIGHPVLGDMRYGGPASLPVGSLALEVGRVALHAHRLELPGGEKFESPWPADFSGWIAKLRDGSGLR